MKLLFSKQAAFPCHTFLVDICNTFQTKRFVCASQVLKFSQRSQVDGASQGRHPSFTHTQLFSESKNSRFRMPHRIVSVNDNPKQNETPNTKAMNQGTTSPQRNDVLVECMMNNYQHNCSVLDDTIPSPVIQALTQDEIEISRKIFNRQLSQMQEPKKHYEAVAKSTGQHNEGTDTSVHSLVGSRFNYVNPFWDPFAKVESIEREVATEFREFSRLVSVAESFQHRALIRRSLRQQYRLCNPYCSGNSRHYGRRMNDAYPKPHRLHERYWDPSPERQALLYNRNRLLTWRDTHVLHNFVSSNGMILPRRVTFATRRQQRAIFSSISTARTLALFPLTSKPSDKENTPIMDPLQYLCDELTIRASRGDLRAKSMVQVMQSLHPNLDYSRFLKAEAEKRGKEYVSGDKKSFCQFSQLLQKYKGSTTSP